MRNHRVLIGAFLALGAIVATEIATGMNVNLALPYGDGCSPPQTPFLAFYSPQSADMLFEPVAGRDFIDIFCQSGLHSVGLKWTLHRNMVLTPFRKGDAEALPANQYHVRIATGELPPGFYDLRVVLDSGIDHATTKDALARRPVTGVCGFGWRAAEMPIRETRPADFAAFWDKAKLSLSKVGLDPRDETPAKTFDAAKIGEYNLAHAALPADYDPQGHKFEEVESWKVSFAGPSQDEAPRPAKDGADGGRVYAWLAKPKGAGPFPAMLVLPGAGFNARPRPLEHARHGYLAIDIQIHGQDVDLPRYDAKPGYFSNFSFDPPESYYYYNVHLRVLQAMNYLASRPDVDPKRIVVVGGSQGGRLGLIAAALDPRVRAVVSTIANSPNYPHLHWVSRCNGKDKPFDKPDDPKNKDRPRTDGMELTGAPPAVEDPDGRCMAYYDPMNFSPDVKCPILMAGGLIDPVSPPYSVWAAYLRLGSSDKSLVVWPGLAHDWSAEFDRRAWRWLERELATPGDATGASPIDRDFCPKAALPRLAARPQDRFSRALDGRGGPVDAPLNVDRGEPPAPGRRRIVIARAATASDSIR